MAANGNNQRMIEIGKEFCAFFIKNVLLLCLKILLLLDIIESYLNLWWFSESDTFVWQVKLFSDWKSGRRKLVLPAFSFHLLTDLAWRKLTQQFFEPVPGVIDQWFYQIDYQKVVIGPDNEFELIGLGVISVHVIKFDEKVDIRLCEITHFLSQKLFRLVLLNSLVLKL